MVLFLLFNSHNNIKPENSLATNNEQQSTEMSQGNSLEELDNNNINETATNYLETETQQTETQQEDITDKMKKILLKKQNHIFLLLNLLIFLHMF